MDPKPGDCLPPGANRRPGASPRLPGAASHQLVLRFRNKFSVTDGASDLLSGLGPDQRPGVLVPVFHESGDHPLQLRNAAETAAPDRLLADQTKPALYQIEPRGTGGSEVEIETRPHRQRLRNGLRSQPRLQLRPIRFAHFHPACLYRHAA